MIFSFWKKGGLGVIIAVLVNHSACGTLHFPLSTTINSSTKSVIDNKNGVCNNFEPMCNYLWELLKTSGTQSSRLHIAYKKCRRDACVPKKMSF
ncbi:MAG: hypothetical protein LBE12_09400 [Planctomycetaceae bacterium]|nr:hypothetical protein [Planctomycetaceae bacterium]